MSDPRPDDGEHLQPAQPHEELADATATSGAAVDPFGRELASPLVRLGARVADAFVLYSLINLVIFAVSSLLGLDPDVEVSGGEQAILLAAVFAVPMLYETIGTAKWGRTGGKYLLGAMVVDRDTGQFPPWGRAINRSVLLYAPFFVFPPFSFMVWPVVVVTMFAVDAQRRGPHDRMARTVVVRTPRPDRMGARRTEAPAPGGDTPPAPATGRRGRRRKAQPSSPPQKKLPPGVEARKRRWQERGPGR